MFASKVLHKEITSHFASPNQGMSLTDGSLETMNVIELAKPNRHYLIFNDVKAKTVSFILLQN